MIKKNEISHLAASRLHSSPLANRLGYNSKALDIASQSEEGERELRGRRSGLLPCAVHIWPWLTPAIELWTLGISLEEVTLIVCPRYRNETVWVGTTPFVCAL